MTPEELEDLLKQIKPYVLAWMGFYSGPYTILDQSMIDAELGNTTFQAWLDVGSNTLRFKVKYPDGTVKNGQITLS